jgi:hypothetical protein
MLNQMRRALCAALIAAVLPGIALAQSAGVDPESAHSYVGSC